MSMWDSLNDHRGGTDVSLNGAPISTLSSTHSVTSDSLSPSFLPVGKLLTEYL